jgi:hypothetical protein
MGIDRKAIYTPRKGDDLIIRGWAESGGKSHTTQWNFRMTQQGLWTPGADFGMSLIGKIIDANFLTAEDDRVKQQRKSIDLMLDHLKIHCPKLLGTGDCEMIGKVNDGNS